MIISITTPSITPEPQLPAPELMMLPSGASVEAPGGVYPVQPSGFLEFMPFAKTDSFLVEIQAITFDYRIGSPTYGNNVYYFKHGDGNVPGFAGIPMQVKADTPGRWGVTFYLYHEDGTVDIQSFIFHIEAAPITETTLTDWSPDNPTPAEFTGQLDTTVHWPPTSGVHINNIGNLGLNATIGMTGNPGGAVGYPKISSDGIDLVTDGNSTLTMMVSFHTFNNFPIVVFFEVDSEYFEIVTNGEDSHRVYEELDYFPSKTGPENRFNNQMYTNYGTLYSGIKNCSGTVSFEIEEITENFIFSVQGGRAVITGFHKL